MDNLTHSLVGALIGQTGLKRRTGLAMPALVFGANLPDIDAGCVVYGIESLAMRRGLTHGPVALVLLPLALAAFLWWFDRWQLRRGTRPADRIDVRFGWLFALSFIACLSHPALDWLNSYGIRLLEPFSSRWFYGDALFIIDPWIWAVLGLALWLSRRREKRGLAAWRRPALAGLAVVLGYINANLAVTAAARAASPDGSIALPVPGAFWERDILMMPDGPALQDWSIISGTRPPLRPLVERPACLTPSQLGQIAPDRADLAAFLFWSRAPYIDFTTTPSGTVAILRDGRFSGTDRFSVSVPLPVDAEACLRE